MRRESAGVNRIEVDPDENKGEETFEEFKRLTQKIKPLSKTKKLFFKGGTFIIDT